MAPEVQAHAFDPFFTTKEVGKGTGLGLSAVHGFARQSGGNAKIESTQGEGTTVYLYLPQAAAAQDGEAAAEQAAKPSRILVVEDDPNVRSTVLVQLDNLGYDTIEAEDGRTALEVLQSDEVIDLLFTDVVMPGGLNGVELAREARSLRPSLKVVFSSGYSQDALRPTERLDNGDILLKKPYLQDALASTIREALGDGGEGGDTPEAA
jgi:CheY-like chemotaxis protein